MTQPKISVVTVAFNHAEFLKQNIESVLAQNYSNFEHIIVDGGSKDGTVELLKQYPHLSWTSEPDRGQTDALNKGFERASGDIIAWLNSDDWYPEGVFHEVAAALEEYPVVVGKCQRTDREGNPTELIANLECSWFDILKYWVYFSIPAQPSIFFKKSILEEVKLPNGRYLDDDLDFVMDYEFWLRLTERYPLSKRLNKVLSYYRMYEDNKTGEDWNPIYRESSRVFSRHAKRVCRHERKLCFMVPFTKPDGSIEQTIHSIHSQTLKDCEVLLVDHCGDRSTARQNKKYATSLGERFEGLSIHYCNSEQTNVYAAMNAACASIRAELVCALLPGCCIAEDFCFHASNTFNLDMLGIAFAVKGDQAGRQLIALEQQGNTFFDVNCVFRSALSLFGCVIRTVTLQELGGFGSSQNSFVIANQFLLRLQYKSWQVKISDSLQLTPGWSSLLPSQEIGELYRNYSNAKAVVELEAERANEPFAATRTAHGFSVILPEGAAAAAEKLLQRAPEDWEDLSYAEDLGRLETLVTTHPLFAPGWYWLSKRYQSLGQSEKAELAGKQFMQGREAEAAL